MLTWLPGWLEPKLSLDGLLTFIGGLLAFFGILWQTSRADRAIKEQLRGEKLARAQQTEERRRAIATALLFEIDHFYRFYVQDVLSILESRAKPRGPLVIKAPGSVPFPVYFGNCSLLGDLPKSLVQGVVNFYGMAESYVSELRERAQIYDAAVREDSPRGFERAESLLPRVKDHCEALVPMAFLTCGLLSEYTDVAFRMPTVAVAEDEHVSKETREFLRIGIEQLRGSSSTR